MIEVRNLVKRFGPTVAVDNVSFDVSQGEVLGFLGPNGAGKTTTMRIITCYLPADAGEREGRRSSTPSSRRWRCGGGSGTCPESAPLYLDMGVIEYLEFVAGMRGIAPGDRGRRIRRHG